MTTCPFCVLADGPSGGGGPVVLRTPDVFVVVPPAQRPRNPGHALVLPRVHATAASADARLRAALDDMVARVRRAGRVAFGASGATVLENDEAPDQTLHHLHVHVIPRRAGDGFRLPDPDKVALSDVEREAQAVALRRALAADRPTATHAPGALPRAEVHLHLHVRDVAASAAFHGRWFGLRERARYGDLVFLHDGASLDLALAPDPAPTPMPTWFHHGFRVADAGTVRRLHASMKAAGVAGVSALVEDGALVSFRVPDPDGYRVEVYWEP